MSKEYYVYIMTNKSRTLYTGVTNNLMRRVDEHKKKLVKGFTSKYNIQFLVYYEATADIQTAIVREKQIKGWLRAKKIALINSMNPQWKDSSEEWFVTRELSGKENERGSKNRKINMAEEYHFLLVINLCPSNHPKWGVTLCGRPSISCYAESV